jgi:hypothetical protein
MIGLFVHITVHSIKEGASLWENAKQGRYSHNFSYELLMNFLGISLELLWNFLGTSQELLRNFSGTSQELLGNFLVTS